MTETPGFTPDQLVGTVSLRRRLAVVAVGLAGLCAAVFLGLLWATEPVALPVRTRIAFAVMVLIGLAWAGFAAWALLRRPLFALDRVIAGWLATAFSTLTAVVAVAVTGSLAAVTVGVTLTGTALIILRRAYTYRRTLLHRLRD
ncbi:hypothetical protein GCM10010435_67510 [Winogradskya consettensis]|uniref:Transmembrane protein n=1 Tax=Winogradskya consettensis TaxID=113560 RepID=A0A919SLA1_9ACTN|nr:hypothetical protein [Actinoplanes consettensis]GIM73814.1 hypothetical protein Aco04nite_37260 [Actinoplanes consettensis]